MTNDISIEDLMVLEEIKCAKLIKCTIVTFDNRTIDVSQDCLKNAALYIISKNMPE